MSDQIRNIVVVGGGSAGWLSACLIAASQSSETTQVTLIESPNIPTIGVGEGTWPSMRHTLNTIGIPESTFLKHCNASFKQGSKFVGWATGNANDSYYHPFSVPQGYTEINVAAHWQDQHSAQPYSNAYCPQPAVCDQQLAPKQIATPDYAFVTNYGYHFDAAKLTSLLMQHGTLQLNINHIVDNVTAIQSHPSGDISALSTEQNGLVQGDLFIDCSGMKGLLIDQHFGIPWRKINHVLLNDCAVAAQVPYADLQQDIQSCTVATAQPQGWIWDIGLYQRRGIGYSYASAFESKSQAEDVLRNHIAANSEGSTTDILTRHITFTPGYRKQFWHNNCLAIGMSAGFIEPLEASALAMVELSLNMLNEEFPQTRNHMRILSKRFNQRFEYRWERVIDFVKLHYLLSQRQSPYWLAQRANSTIPERLHELLTLWQYQAPSRNDFYENEEIFSSASYQYILYGMGFTTQFANNATTPQSAIQANKMYAANAQNATKFCAGLPSNRTFLNLVHSH